MYMHSNQRLSKLVSGPLGFLIFFSSCGRHGFPWKSVHGLQICGTNNLRQIGFRTQYFVFVFFSLFFSRSALVCVFFKIRDEKLSKKVIYSFKCLLAYPIFFKFYIAHIRPIYIQMFCSSTIFLIHCNTVNPRQGYVGIIFVLCLLFNEMEGGEK